MPRARRLYGKYRATVVGVADPLMLGRVQVECPVLGPVQVWAVACLPWFGDAGVLALPAPGQPVWVEFEGGDPALPIWSGGRIEAPVVTAPGSVTIAAAGAQFTLRDDPARAVSVATGSGATIEIGAIGIRVANGAGAAVELVGPSVIVNGGALVVT